MLCDQTKELLLFGHVTVLFVSGWIVDLLLSFSEILDKTIKNYSCKLLCCDHAGFCIYCATCISITTELFGHIAHMSGGVSAVIHLIIGNDSSFVLIEHGFAHFWWSFIIVNFLRSHKTGLSEGLWYPVMEWTMMMMMMMLMLACGRRGELTCELCCFGRLHLVM